MAWQSSLWARWLGWTALYALVLLWTFVLTGPLIYYLYPSHSNRPEWLTATSLVLFYLVPAVLAFGIGVQFRSRWWGLGPLVAYVVLAVAVAITVWLDAVAITVWIDADAAGSWEEITFAIWVILLPMIGGVLSLVALAGVWWGKRRHVVNAQPY